MGPLHEITSAANIAPDKVAGIFNCPNVPSVGGHDLSEGIKECRVEVSPLLWTLKVADVASIIVMAIGVEPPCDAELVAVRKRTQDTELQILANISNVAVLHGQITARNTVAVSAPIITNPPETTPMDCTGCFSASKNQIVKC